MHKIIRQSALDKHQNSGEVHWWWWLHSWVKSKYTANLSSYSIKILKQKYINFVINNIPVFTNCENVKPWIISSHSWAPPQAVCFPNSVCYFPKYSIFDGNRIQRSRCEPLGALHEHTWAHFILVYWILGIHSFVHNYWSQWLQSW